MMSTVMPSRRQVILQQLKHLLTRLVVERAGELVAQQGLGFLAMARGIRCCSPPGAGRGSSPCVPQADLAQTFDGIQRIGANLRGKLDVLERAVSLHQVYRTGTRSPRRRGDIPRIVLGGRAHRAHPRRRARSWHRPCRQDVEGPWSCQQLQRRRESQQSSPRSTSNDAPIGRAPLTIGSVDPRDVFELDIRHGRAPITSYSHIRMFYPRRGVSNTGECNPVESPSAPQFRDCPLN